MKILRYLIFLSILSGIFFLIYRQSDEKGFRRWWTSLKMATIIAAILAGLIPSPVQAIEPHVSNNSPSIERTLSNKELDLLDDPNSQAILVKTGDSTSSVPTSPGRAQPNNFPSGSTGGRRIPHVNPYRTPPRVVDQGPVLGAAANPAGAGNGGGAAEFDDNNLSSKKEQSQESKTFDYDYRSNDPKNKKKSEDQCPIDEQNKAGFSELPDSENFSYNMDQGRGLKKQAQKVWKNPKAKKEVLRMLKRFGDKNANIQEKPLTGFKKLTELKNSGPGPRIIIYRGKNQYPVVVGFCMRNDLDATLDKLKKNFT